MKKLISLLLALAICLSLAACTTTAKPESTDSGQTTETEQTADPAVDDSVRFTKLVSGNCHALALDTGGRIWGWGRNQYSCLGSIDTYTDKPALFCDAAVFTDIQASIDFSAALDSDGGLWTWGTNTCGQLGDGSTDERGEPVKVLENVSSFAVGYDYVIAVADGGRLYTWGNGSNHMLLKQDTNDTSCVLAPTPVDTELTFSYVASGQSGCVAYDTDGIRYAWGITNSVAGYDAAQLGFASGETVMPYLLKPITSDTIGQSEFVIYGNTVYALSDGNLYLAGGKDCRLTSFESDPSFDKFTLVKEGIKAVSPSMYGVLAIDAGGNVWGWGGSAFPPCTNGEPKQLTNGIVFSDAVVLNANDQEVFAIDENGVLYTWSAAGEAPQEVPVH